jgi:enoyl-CoA hydratase/carnithine racemase
MCTMMANKLREWHKDPKSAPRTLIMSGAGEKSFCAGGDIVSIYHGHKAGLPISQLLNFFATEYLLDYSLSQIKHIE